MWSAQACVAFPMNGSGSGPGSLSICFAYLDRLAEYRRKKRTNVVNNIRVTGEKQARSLIDPLSITLFVKYASIFGFCVCVYLFVRY